MQHHRNLSKERLSRNMYPRGRGTESGRLQSVAEETRVGRHLKAASCVCKPEYQSIGDPFDSSDRERCDAPVEGARGGDPDERERDEAARRRPPTLENRAIMEPQVRWQSAREAWASCEAVRGSDASSAGSVARAREPNAAGARRLSRWTLLLAWGEASRVAALRSNSRASSRTS